MHRETAFLAQLVEFTLFLSFISVLLSHYVLLISTYHYLPLSPPISICVIAFICLVYKKKMYLSLMVLFFLSVPFAFASPLTHSFLLPCLSLYPRTSLHRLYFFVSYIYTCSRRHQSQCPYHFRNLLPLSFFPAFLPLPSICHSSMTSTVDNTNTTMGAPPSVSSPFLNLPFLCLAPGRS